MYKQAKKEKEVAPKRNRVVNPNHCCSKKRNLENDRYTEHCTFSLSMHKAFEVEEKVLLGGWWSAVQREEINVMCHGKSSFVVLRAK